MMLLTLRSRGETLGYSRRMQGLLAATLIFGLVAMTYGVFATVQTYTAA